MKFGFIINTLRLTGNAVDNAEVVFTLGTNVISGPSDTGKTYIFQCINYMLGSSSPPKGILQARPYTKIYLEITSSQDQPYTLESDLKGGDFNLYKSKIDEITFGQDYKILSRKHNPKSEETISAFLLKLNNLYPKKVRTNAKGKTRQISYRDIVKFLLVDETRITTDKSLVLGGQYTKITEEKNILKFITSGKDDSDIISILSKSEITNKRGRLDLLKELIIESDYDLYRMKEDSSNDSLEKLIQQIDELKGIYEKVNEEFINLTSQRNDLASGYEHSNRKKRELEELLKRSTLLKDHYETDIKRLKSTIEACVLLADKKDEISYCPLCKNKIPHDCDVNDINKIVNSCNAEIEKIYGLLKELIESVNLIREEISQIDLTLEELLLKLKNIEKTLKKDLGIKLKNILESIDSLNEKKSFLLGINIKQAQLQKYISQQEKLEIIIDSSKSSNEFESLSTANMSSISNQLELVLQGIKYPDLTAISYSEDKSDFVISGEDRELSGKGHRAIIYASFIVAIQEFLFNKDYSIGVPVLDSPLVTYKKPNSDNEEIPIDLAMDFYRYISKNKLLDQIIIIENEEAPEDILENINLIEFTRLKTVGRYGFIPL